MTSVDKVIRWFLVGRILILVILMFISPWLIMLNIIVRLFEPLLNNPYSTSAWVERIGILLQFLGVVSLLPQAFGKERTERVQKVLQELHERIKGGHYRKATRLLMFVLGCFVATYSFFAGFDSSADVNFKLLLSVGILSAYVIPEFSEVLMLLIQWLFSWTKLELPRLLAIVSLPLLSAGTLMQFISTFIR